MLNEKEGNIVPPFVYPYALLIRVGLHVIPCLRSISISFENEPVARISFHDENKLHRGGDADRTRDAEEEERKKVNRKYYDRSRLETYENFFNVRRDHRGKEASTDKSAAGYGE